MKAVGNWANYGVILTRPHREPWEVEGAAVGQGKDGPQLAVHFRDVETEAHCAEETWSPAGWGRASIGWGTPLTASWLSGPHGLPGKLWGQPLLLTVPFTRTVSPE